MSTDVSICRDVFSIYTAGHRLRAEFIRPRVNATKSARPALVFLHEGLGSIGQWRDFPEKLCAATGCQALVYDRRGHGGSDPLTEPRKPDYLHEEALISLPAILEQCGLEKHVLIGHSDGGSIALIFAGAYPQRVTGIVTEAAHVFVEDITVEGIKRAVETYETTDLKKRLTRFHGHNTELMFRGWADIWLSPDFRDWNIEEYPPDITCPLLVIQGKDDEYGTPAQVEAIVGKAGGPSRRMLIDDCGHVPHLQARDRVFSEMVNFISGLVQD
ncbi:MAG: alpha/beta hydrolase [Deltaproteobacteria bacterium]|nr:alpha/beta hydrolase [Deltaproteobacteria bacterium]